MSSPFKIGDVVFLSTNILQYNWNMKSEIEYPYLIVNKTHPWYEIARSDKDGNIINHKFILYEVLNPAPNDGTEYDELKGLLDEYSKAVYTQDRQQRGAISER